MLISYHDVFVTNTSATKIQTKSDQVGGMKFI